MFCMCVCVHVCVCVCAHVHKYGRNELGRREELLAFMDIGVLFILWL